MPLISAFSIQEIHVCSNWYILIPSHPSIPSDAWWSIYRSYPVSPPMSRQAVTRSMIEVRYLYDQWRSDQLSLGNDLCQSCLCMRSWSHLGRNDEHSKSVIVHLHTVLLSELRVYVQGAPRERLYEWHTQVISLTYISLTVIYTGTINSLTAVRDERATWTRW
jgi:hypothetical protein